MYILNIRFALFVAKNVRETIRQAHIMTCFNLHSRKLSPRPLPVVYKKWVG